MSDGQYDVVLFGATGFTGALTAEYLARRVPTGCRWALAGRDRDKLARVRERLSIADTDGAPSLLWADVTDPASLREMAEAARVVISTVGPYTQYGEPVVAACAEAGNDYVDLCGEPEFVDRMYVRHHARASETGARLVHACGFDSIPADLGAFFTVKQLPSDVPIRLDGCMRINASFSGGTFASAMTAFSRPLQMLRSARDRAQMQPRPPARRVRAITPTPRHDRETGLWMVPLPTVDLQLVARSAAAIDAYGPDFSYRHYAGVRHLPIALGAGAGLAAMLAAAQVPPLRARLAGLRTGSGPSAQQRAQSWFRMRFTGIAAGSEVVTEVAGGDPGYDETAKMLGESALCLAHDQVPAAAGQLTPAAAMGDALLDRLLNAGITFRVLRG